MPRYVFYSSLSLYMISDNSSKYTQDVALQRNEFIIAGR